MLPNSSSKALAGWVALLAAEAVVVALSLRVAAEGLVGVVFMTADPPRR
jgi:hypothetical protein